MEISNQNYVTCSGWICCFCGIYGYYFVIYEFGKNQILKVREHPS